MTTKHTSAFNQQMHKTEHKNISNEDASMFTANMSSDQWREICAKVKASGSTKGNSNIVTALDVTLYCIAHNILPDRKNQFSMEFKDPKEYYNLLVDNQEIKVDKRECFVMSNDLTKKVLTVMFHDDDEIREIEY